MLQQLSFLSIIFGAFLTEKGIGDFISDFATALMGRKIGRPAKVATIDISLFGTILDSFFAEVFLHDNATALIIL